MRPILGVEGEKLLDVVRSHVSLLRGRQDRLKQFFELYSALYLLKPKKERPIGQLDTGAGVEVITNDVCNAVNVMQNLLAEAKVKTHVVSADPAVDGEADKAELFYKNVLYHSRRRLGKPQLHLARMDLSKLGRACLFPYWESSPRYTGPALSRIDPRKVFWEGGGPYDEYACVIVEEKRPVPEIESKYGVTLKEFSGYDRDAKYKEMATVFDVWKWEQVKRRRVREQEVETEEAVRRVEVAEEYDDMVVVNCIVSRETVLKKPEVMTGYRHLPVVTFGAYPTGEEKPEYEFVPISFFIHTAVLLERRLRTAQFKRMDQQIRLPLIFKSASGQLAKSMSLEMGTYNIWPMRLQESIDFPEWRGSPVDVENLGTFLDAQRQKGSFTDLALGEMIMISGVAASRFWQGNVLKMKAPADQYAWALERVLNMFRDFAIQFGGADPLTLERSPTGKEGAGVFDIVGQELKGSKVFVSVEPSVPADIRYRDRQFGLRLLQLGRKNPFSLAWVMSELFYIEQPEVEMQRKRREIKEYGDIVGLLEEPKEKQGLAAGRGVPPGGQGGEQPGAETMPGQVPQEEYEFEQGIL